MFDLYDRDAIAASKILDGVIQIRKLIPADSLWANDSSFNNRYSGRWPQLILIIVVQNQLELILQESLLIQTLGEMQMMPSSDPKCTGSSKDTGFGTCLAKDTTSLANNEYWINPGQFRDFRGELERNNTFIFINHEMDNGSELFAELGRYDSEYRRLKEPAETFQLLF